MRFPAQRILRQVAAAVGAVLLAALFRWIFSGALGDRIPFTTFYPAVMLAALYGGLFAGVLATLLSFVAIVWGGAIPGGTPFVLDTANWTGLAIFLVNGVVISAIAEGTHRARKAEREARENDRRASEELRRSEERLARVLEGSADGFFDVDFAPRRISTSERYREILGRPGLPAEFPLSEMGALIEAGNLEEIRASIEGLRIGERDRFAWEFQVRLHDGKLRWFLHRVTPLAGNRPRYVGIFSFVEEPGMVGSPERTRQLYGRVLPIHVERAGLRRDALID